MAYCSSVYLFYALDRSMHCAVHTFLSSVIVVSRQFCVPTAAVINNSTWRRIHCQKRLAIFPTSAGMSLTKLSLAGSNFKVFTARESLFSDIPAGDGKIYNLILQCRGANLRSNVLHIHQIVLKVAIFHLQFSKNLKTCQMWL
jgi:hypothetical protein